MSRDIRPLNPEDLPELSQFLATGFQARPDADFATPAVLRWKYLELSGLRSVITGTGDDTSPQHSPRESLGDPDLNCHAPLSYVACNESGGIVGHLGLCRTYFQGRGITVTSGRVPTMHIIDWLGSSAARSVGIHLMRLSHQGVTTQFGLGVSPAALAVGERAGYQLRELVPVYNRVLRVGHWLRKVGPGPVNRILGFTRDVAGRLARLPQKPQVALTLERVPAFGSEISKVVELAERHVIMTDREPARLNAFLRFPRQDFSGWHLRDETGKLRGFALLNLVPHDEGRTRTGKIVDCLLDQVDVPLWQAAIVALTRQLAREGADVAQCYASTQWMSAALSSSGFVTRFGVKFHIRDPQGLIPTGATFHLTTLEGDYAYT